MNKTLLYLLFLTFTFSCSQKRDEGKSNQNGDLKNITLEKLDSVQIEYLGNPRVHDIDPKSGIVLFMEHGDTFEDIYVADFEGNIQYSYPKFGDLPDTYGILFAPLKIIGENEFLAYGLNGIMTYTFSGELLSRTKINDITPFNFARVLMGYGMGITNEGLIYINQGSRKMDYDDINLYSEISTMILIDKSTGDKKPIIKIPESSLYRNGNFFQRDGWAPVFEYTDDHLLVVFGGEPKIYVYDNHYPFTLINEIDLNIPDYYYFKGESQYTSDLLKWWFISGRIETLTLFDGYYIIGYFPGYNNQDQIESFENRFGEEAREFGDRMRMKYQSRVAIFDSLGNLVNDFLPTDLSPSSIILREGQLWVMEKPDPDVEKEYFRLYRVGLKD